MKKQKSYEQMTTAQLREATRKYDRELPVAADGLPGRALTPAERKQWNKARPKVGRPKVGGGIKRVMISLESHLLKESDLFARAHHLNRSQMISAGLRKIMAKGR